MIWLTWRQHRSEGVITLGVLVLISVFLLVTGLQMSASFQQLGLSTCPAQTVTSDTCRALGQAFQNQFGPLLNVVPLLLLLPLLVGALVGAPLVAREVEQRTYLLVWAQSITLRRWLTMQLVLVLGAALLASGLVLGLLLWWYGPLAQLNGSFSPGIFDLSGPVWVASLLLALALGVFAGALTRRVVLAIFLTLVLFLAIRIPVAVWWRPNFQPPITVTWPVLDRNATPQLSNQDWQLDQGFIDAQGNKFNNFAGRCTLEQNLPQCLQASGTKSMYLTYQPANRFWTFQWIETGIYVGFSVLALFASVWLVRRRLN
jgi:hypothetical protein